MNCDVMNRRHNDGALLNYDVIDAMTSYYPCPASVSAERVDQPTRGEVPHSYRPVARGRHQYSLVPRQYQAVDGALVRGMLGYLTRGVPVTQVVQTWKRHSNWCDNATGIYNGELLLVT